MARLGTHPIGFELQSATSGVEWTTSTGGPVISTAQYYGGAASLRCAPTAAARYVMNSFRADSNTDIYWKFMLRIASAPSAKTTISGYGDSANFYGAKLRLGTDRKLYTDNSGLTSETAGSTVLATDTWYRIECYYNETANTFTVKLATGDGTASTEINAGVVDDIGGGGRITLGVVDATTADLYFDDWVVDDAGYPGAGRVAIAVPTGAGDNAATTGVYSYINEIPISDTATSGSTIVELDSNGVIADYNMTNSSTLGIGSSDTIKAVAVVARIREEAAGTSSYNLRIKSASGGTVTASSNGDGGNATARTNPTSTTALARILYTVTDPTTGVAWTPTGTNSIDNMQIGVANVDSDSTPDLWVLGLYGMVEYVPASSTTVTPGLATLTLTAQTPTVTIGTIITTASPSSLTLTAKTPTVIINTILTPGIATLTLTAQTPTVAISDNKLVTPGVASLTVTAQIPTVSLSDNKTATPGVASLTLAAQTPTLAYTDHKTVTPDTATLTLSPLTPTVVATDNKFATPGVATLTLTAFAPTVSYTDNVQITLTTSSLVIATFAPGVAVSSSTSLTPGTASLTLTAFAPTVVATNNVYITLDTASLTLSPLAPTVTITANTYVTPGTASLNLTPLTPTVEYTDHKTVTPITADLVLTPLAPTVAVSDHKVVAPGVAIMVLAMFAPTVEVGTSTTITPGTARLRLTPSYPIINGQTQETDLSIIWVDGQLAIQVDEDQYIMV